MADDLAARPALDAREARGTRTLVYIALALTIVVLASVVTVLWYTLQLGDAPRSAAEKETAAARNAVHENPGDPELWAALALSQGRAGEWREAQAAIEAGREIEAHPSLDLAEAEVVRMRGDTDEAISLLEETKRKAEQYYSSREEELAGRGVSVEMPRKYVAEAAILLARIYHGQGDLSGALAEYDVALGIDSLMADVLVERADVRAESGDADGARDDYERALSMIPDYPEATEGLRRLGGE